MRRQEIARVVRVGSTPRGTEKEQREHLPPHQEQLFNPPRQGDAGMGGATKGGEVAGKASLFCFSLSPVHLYILFKPLLYTQWVHGEWLCRFLSHSSLSQIKLRKHQLSVYLQIYKIRADAITSWTGEISANARMHLCAPLCPCVYRTEAQRTHTCAIIIVHSSSCPSCLFHIIMWPLIQAGV